MTELIVPPRLYRNSLEVNRSDAVEGACWLIDHMSRHVGVPDLGGLEVLDFGCGVRFTQAFVNRGVPIGHYVGVDVSSDVIDFLKANVADDRLEHYHLDAHNESYNPTGQPLETLSVPEIEGRQFDLICLFSVFTHLAPHDYSTMLRLLRRFVKPDGRLFFTLFINETTPGGYGYIDRFTAMLADAQDDALKAELAAAAERSPEPDVADFVDVDPAHPLRCALYSRRHALELIDGTGWEVLEVAPPDAHLQHHIVCAPA